MMSHRTREYVRFLMMFTLLGSAGLAASVYVLVQQRAASPFADDYTVDVAFTEASGVTSGIGQPVNVAGVKVGQVTGTRLRDGVTVVSLRIERPKLPRVYANARAVLEPITPLKDLQINLDPGRPPAKPLARGATLGVARTRPPTASSELLSALDADSRAYLGTLIQAMDEGTAGRGADMRRLYLALAPTAGQVRRISASLALRRRALARLVHNLGRVTREASRDRRLATVVGAGNQTLEAIARQEAPLRASLEKLPPTLDATRSTLVNLQRLARKLEPTLDSLQPALRRLPYTLRTLEPFADASTLALRRDVRPLIRDAQPLARRLGPTTRSLSELTPGLSSSFQVLRYLTNQLAYNPAGDDEGFLFWASWFFHNFNSVASSGDAHGGIGRASTVVSCNGLAGLDALRDVLGVAGACPE